MSYANRQEFETGAERFESRRYAPKTGRISKTWLVGINGVYADKDRFGNETGLFRCAIKLIGGWKNIDIFSNRGAAAMAFNIAYYVNGGRDVQSFNYCDHNMDKEEFARWMYKENVSQETYQEVLDMIEVKRRGDSQLSWYQEVNARFQ